MTVSTGQRKTTAPDTCTLDNCDRPHAGRGYCSAHYKRWYRYGDPLGAPDKTSRFEPRLITPDVREDLEWMAEHGETLRGAAERISRHTDVERDITTTQLRDALRNGPHTRLLAQFARNTDLRDGGDA